MNLSIAIKHKCVDATSESGIPRLGDQKTASRGWSCAFIFPSFQFQVAVVEDGILG